MCAPPSPLFTYAARARSRQDQGGKEGGNGEGKEEGYELGKREGRVGVKGRGNVVGGEGGDL